MKDYLTQRKIYSGDIFLNGIFTGQKRSYVFIGPLTKIVNLTRSKPKTFFDNRYIRPLKLASPVVTCFVLFSPHLV